MEIEKISGLITTLVCRKESSFPNHEEEEILLNNPNETPVRKKNISYEVNDVRFQVAEERPQTHHSIS